MLVAMFDTATYQQRREGLMGRMDSGLLLILGNDESGMSYADNYYPFRQDSTFLYYMGLDRPGYAALIDLDEGATTLYGHELTIDDIVWMGPQASLADRAARVGIDRVADPDALQAKLAQAKEQGREVHFLPPYRPEHELKLLAWLGVQPGTGKEQASRQFIRSVVAQRSIKSEEEIAQLEIAVNLTADLHLAAMKMARPGMIEQEVAGNLKGIAGAGGGMLSFPAIVTVNGQTLHNHYHGNIMQEGELLLVDSGAEAPSHYAGDMTRTFPVSTRFTPKQKEIYEVVLASQLSAIDALRPGISYREVHLISARVILEGLKSAGLVKGNIAEALEAGVQGLFFPHGLGHMMGLDVHDMENLGEDFVGYGQGFERSSQFGLRSLRLGRTLEPGFVLTVEPGIYFIPELIDRWKADGAHSEFLNFDKIETYKDFGGIRIEDDYLITSSGARLLGKPVPKTVADVEAMRA